MNVFSTKRIARAGAIAGFYVILTYVFSPFAFGPFQVRPAEALCLLPLIFPESVPALFVGCALSNLLSAYSVFDVVIGSFTTLFAGVCTWLIGKTVKSKPLKITLGGLFPVIFNAFAVPVVIVFLGGDLGGHSSAIVAYFTCVLSIFLSQAFAVYALGAPLYLSLEKLLFNKKP